MIWSIRSSGTTILAVVSILVSLVVVSLVVVPLVVVPLVVSLVSPPLIPTSESLGVTGVVSSLIFSSFSMLNSHCVLVIIKRLVR